MPGHLDSQMANYESMLNQVVYPFEKAGYKVDIFSATYPSPYDFAFMSSFGLRIKKFKMLKFRSNTSQATNAAENLNAVRDYARNNGITYRFTIFSRQDMRFLKNMKDVIESFKAPDDTVLLYVKHNYGSTHQNFIDAENRCSNPNNFGWSIKERNRLSWWCNDRIQIVPWKHFEAFYQLIDGPTLLPPPDPARPGFFARPRWPFECWEELAPLIGGTGHIDFMTEDVLTVCKASQEHGMKRRVANMRKRKEAIPERCEIEHR